MRDNHHELGMKLNNLAVLSRGQGNLTEAKNLYEQTLSIFTATLGEEHPHTIICGRNYATLLEEMGEPAAGR